MPRSRRNNCQAGDVGLAINRLEIGLLRQAQAGDQAAFEQLWSGLAPPVRRFVRRLIGASPAEDDIVQDVFIALFYHLERIVPPERLRPYVFRIARNCCYDELQKQGRYEVASLDDEQAEDWTSLADGVPDGAAPDETAHWLLLYGEVKAA